MRPDRRSGAKSRVSADPQITLTITQWGLNGPPFTVSYKHNMKHLISNQTAEKLAEHKAGRIVLHASLAIERPDYRQLALAGILREFRINLYWLYIVAFAVASVLK